MTFSYKETDVENDNLELIKLSDYLSQFAHQTEKDLKIENNNVKINHSCWQNQKEKNLLKLKMIIQYNTKSKTHRYIKISRIKGRNTNSYYIKQKLRKI